MSFSNKFKTLRSGNAYDSNAQLEMSAHEEETTREVEEGANGDTEEKKSRLSRHLVDERPSGFILSNIFTSYCYSSG